MSYFSVYGCEYRGPNFYCVITCKTYPSVEGWNFCPYCGIQLKSRPVLYEIPLLLPLPNSPRLGSEAGPEEEAEKEAEEEAKEPYVPPPRVKEAEDMWPFMICKALVKNLYSMEKVNYRSHYALLTFLAEKNGLSIQELVKKNPITLFPTSNLFNIVGKNAYQEYQTRLRYGPQVA